MRRSLSTTTALVTGLALVFPTSFPLSAQDNGQRASEVCTEDMTRQECNRAERRAARREARGQDQGFGQDQGTDDSGETQPAGQAEPLPDDGREPGAALPDPMPEPAPDSGGFGGGGAATGDQGGRTPALEELEQQLGDDAQEPARAEPQPQETPDPEPTPEPQSEPDPSVPGVEAEGEAEVRRPRRRNGAADDAGSGAGFGGDQSPAVIGDQPGGGTGGQPPRDVESLEEVLGGQGDGEAEAEVGLQDEAPAGPSEAETEAASGAPEEWMAVEGGGQVVDEVTEEVTDETARSSDEEFGERRRRPRDRDRNGDRDADRDGDRDRDRAGRDDDDDSVPDFLRGAVVGAAGALIVGSLLSGDREVVSTTPDRVVVRDRYGNLQVLRDDDAILRQPGSEVTTRRYQDGSTETIVQQPDGSQVVTLRSAEGRVIKRVVIARNGTRTVLFDDTVQYEPVVVEDLPPVNRTVAPQVDPGNEDALRAALMRESQVGRSFSLYQVRQIDRVRYLAPAVQVENITFETGSAAISPSQAEQLLALGELMSSMIADNPGEMFLIEGHTDAQGGAAMNLTLSDRRAESVALALTEYFGVSPANMVLQGYGESDLRVPTQAAERANRRVVVRRITPLLQVAQEG